MYWNGRVFDTGSDVVTRIPNGQNGLIICLALSTLVLLCFDLGIFDRLYLRELAPFA